MAEVKGHQAYDGITCPECVYLGEYVDLDREMYTLFFCPQGGWPTQLACYRQKDENGEYDQYLSGDGRYYPFEHPLRVAFDLAQEKGLVQ